MRGKEEADKHLISVQETADRCSGNVFLSLEKQWSLLERDNLSFLLHAGKTGCLFHAGCLL